MAEQNQSAAEPESERDHTITRVFDVPASVLFEAFSKPELFGRWWIPKSFGLTLLSCEMDVRVGGQYRLTIRHGDSEPMAFFGTYTEVIPHSRIVWTNDEGGDGGPVTTATFEEKGGQTLLVMHDLYSSKEALDAAMASGEKSCMAETLDQLDKILVGLGASSGEG